MIRHAGVSLDMRADFGVSAGPEEGGVPSRPRRSKKEFPILHEL
jgi:hypothetical protein